MTSLDSIKKEDIMILLQTNAKGSLVAAINELHKEKANVSDIQSLGAFTPELKTKLEGIQTSANNYSLPQATASVLGGVKVGTNIVVTSGTISVPDGTTSVKGLVKLNNTLTSTSETEALTAAKGKELKDALDVKAEKTYVDTKVAALVGAAPAALDTLEELATALKANEDIVNSILTTIGNKADGGDFGLHTGNTVVHITAAERTAWNAKASTAVATTSANGLMSSADKTKLNGLSQVSYSVVTTSANGLMSSTDKTKLDGIAANANNYALPTSTASVLGGVKTGTNITNSSGTISVANASTSAKGVVQLDNALNSTATDKAATASAIKAVNDTIISHTGNVSNPHKVTKEQVGLGNVPNYAVATNAEALAGAASDKLVTPAGVKAYVDQQLSILRAEIVSVLAGE